MEIKILQVFYGKDGLPYKDKDRQVHFPIAGTGFLGASNTTKIKFYYDELDNLDETTWVAVSKLPNGKVGSRVLESYLDEELNEHYALLELGEYYTQYKGDVFISLQGYQGGVNLDFNEETQQYEIHGTPTIAATGSIKFTINYAGTFVGSGQTENINFQRILADLGTKLGIRAKSEFVVELPLVGENDTFYVVHDDPENENLTNIYIWNEYTHHYIWVGDNSLYLGNYYTKEQGDDFELGMTNAVKTLRERVDSLENQVDVSISGSPKGVYATVSALETADPDHDYIYVVLDDGHWYYWNTNEWADGGEYLSTLPDDSFDLESTNSIQNKVVSSAKKEINPITNKAQVIFNETNKKYFGIKGSYGERSLLTKSPLFISTNGTTTEIEVYKHYSISEITNGKTLQVGSKLIAIYGHTQPSGAVWNAILLRSANYNGESYLTQSCDYFIQFTGTAIQVMHVISGGTERAFQGSYGQIINLDIPMEVVAIYNTGININNAIPQNEPDCIETTIVNAPTVNVSTNDIVYLPLFDGTQVYYQRFVDDFGIKELKLIKVLSGYYSNGQKMEDSTSYVSIYDVRCSTKAYITGRTFNNYDYYILFDENFEFISSLHNNTGSAIYWTDHEVDVSNASYIAVCNNNNTSIIKANSLIGSQESSYIGDKTNAFWGDKKVVWFGTSIPAAGGWQSQLYPNGNQGSYPIKLARELGFECKNEAIGGSCVHCKSPDRISADNPYGFSNDFDLCSKCITNTTEEMQWIIDHFDSPIFTVNTHDSLSDDDKANILGTSYQTLLAKYLNGGSYGTPDLYVFNYGWNDSGQTLEEQLALIQQYGEDTKYCFLGAMNFLLKIIYSNNPHTSSCIIGEIREHAMNESEKYVAEQWCIPFCDLKNHCGFSSKIITTTGYWQNNRWVESGGTERQCYVYQCWLQDNIHPHSSQDGRALNRITKCLVPFFMNDLREVLAE